MLKRRIISIQAMGKQKNPSEAVPPDSLQQEMEENIRQHRKRSRRRMIAGTAALVIAAFAIFLVVYLQTYTKVRTSDTYRIGNAADNSYQEFAGGVLKYSRDGISYLNRKGEEKWNQPYQIKTPFLDVNSRSAAVADKGGNDIMVFQREGLKGEIHTTLPIERITVSEQGIVGAVLKNESSPQIICYDTAGNILVELKASPAGVGYPLDLALSADGKLLQVVYLAVDSGEMVSRVCYYNFGEAGEDKTDHQVAEKEYRDSLMASGFFVGDSASAAVGDNCLTVFRGKETPQEGETVAIQGEIQSVFHSDNYIGLIVKTNRGSGYELSLYDTSGRQIFSKEIGETYKSAKICDSQIILYDGKKCSIYMRTGIHRFEGGMDNNILEIFPVGGVNKYIVINANGMEEVRLVK